MLPVVAARKRLKEQHRGFLSTPECASKRSVRFRWIIKQPQQHCGIVRSDAKHPLLLQNKIRLFGCCLENKAVHRQTAPRRRLGQTGMKFCRSAMVRLARRDSMVSVTQRNRSGGLLFEGRRIGNPRHFTEKGESNYATTH
jgi:hypothetical protein